MGEESASVQKRVQAARERQRKRFEGERVKSNSEMTSGKVKKYCFLNGECLGLLRQAVSAMGLSARGYYKTIKVAQTIADLSGEEKIRVDHIGEALQYRPKD